MAYNNLNTGSGLIAREIRMVWYFLLSLLMAFALATGSQAQTQGQTENTTLTKQQLEQLVAPIALYPDPLLTQVFMASTYPLEIVQAARWATTNSKLKGKALEDALQKQSWDPSIKSMVAVPDVLKMMNEKLEWTEALGNAFLAQQDDVMNAVQALRARADASGSLKTTPQQKVSKQTTSGGQTAVIIEPADPEVVYVPAYEPEVVYGGWPYPDYPPYEWYPSDYVAGSGIWFGGRIAAGAALWAGWNWANNHVNVNPLRYNNFNRTNINNPSWTHDVAHRKGVPYKNTGVATKFGQQGGNALGAKTDLGQKGLSSGAAKQIKGAGATKQIKSSGTAKNMKSSGTKQVKSSASTKQIKSSGTTKHTKSATTKSLTKSGGQSVKHTTRSAGPTRQVHSGTVGRSSGARSVGGGAPRVSGVGRGGGGAGRGGGGRRSDIALKHDIALLDRLDSGLGLYRFSYNGSDRSYVGVLAQEVQTVMPEAVVRGSDGYLRVFYDKIGVKFQTYNQWLKTGSR